MLSTSLTYHSDDPDSFHYTIYKYNDSKKITSLQLFDEGGEGDVLKYFYDNYGNKILELRHQGSENFTLTKNNLCENITDGYKVFKYDSNNNIIEELRYAKRSDNKCYIGKKTKFEYNNDNLLVKRESYNQNHQDYISSFIKYFYNSKKQKVKEEKFGYYKHSNNYIKEFEYNDSGFLTNIIKKEENKIYNIEFKYKFDKKGNWVKQTKIINGERRFQWIRNIEYY